MTNLYANVPGDQLLDEWLIMSELTHWMAWHLASDLSEHWFTASNTALDLQRIEIEIMRRVVFRLVV